MIPLALTLDDMDFDALVALGRSRLPALAPDWTDHNHHDPGITLIDLLAWIADTQLYAIGRDRLDERLAMAALLGLAPRGAAPATGVLYPAGGPDGTVSADFDIAAATRLGPASGCAPRLETLAAVTMLPVTLVRLTAEGGPGGTIDLTDANKRARTSFEPFGRPPVPGAALVARLAGPLPAREVRLSLGFEIERGAGTEEGAAPGGDRLGKVRLFYRRNRADEIPLTRLVDTSRDMQRSGAIVVSLPADGPHAGSDTHDIVIRADSASALMPRLLRVAPNALPVAQKATFVRRDRHGTGRANQKIRIEPRTLFESGELVEGRAWRLTERGADGRGCPLVRVGGAPGELWQAGELEAAGPADRIYALSEAADGSRIEIGFGNGVNGLRPGPWEPIEIALELSCGAGGNVASPVDWMMAAPRTRWRNRQPLTGGRDPESVAELLDAARRRLRERRPLTASRQIEEAALALPEAFGVTRASIVEGWEPGRRRPASAATRTLIVARRGEAAESGPWLRAISRSLRPRLPLAERLVVAAPRYRDFRIAARIAAAPGADPAALAKEVRQDLADRLATGAAWPLGRDVSATAIAGWIRRLPGVAAVDRLVLLGPDGGEIGEVMALGRDALPRLLPSREDDIVVALERRR